MAPMPQRERTLRVGGRGLVDEFRAFSPLAWRSAKKLLNDTEDATLSVPIELEGYYYSRLRQSDDFREGVEASTPSAKRSFRGS